MHNGALLKYWGPLASFSEFPGKQMNEKLQKMNTNYHLHMLADILAKAPCLLEVDYNSLLDYLHQIGRLYRAFSDLPHPPNAIILPPQAQ
ncbi:hypothetical protein L208DRAFT_1102612, partial [Tricholoma matsutake]